eukprot:366259-Chlamydomonas_euryale.AAC.19
MRTLHQRQPAHSASAARAFLPYPPCLSPNLLPMPGRPDVVSGRAGWGHGMHRAARGCARHRGSAPRGETPVSSPGGSPEQAGGMACTGPLADVRVIEVVPQEVRPGVEEKPRVEGKPRCRARGGSPEQAGWHGMHRGVRGSARHRGGTAGGVSNQPGA